MAIWDLVRGKKLGEHFRDEGFDRQKGCTDDGCVRFDRGPGEGGNA